ncbi:hypothetical protein DQM68_06435 [Leptospira mayottensis]|uniref:Uncharacterized protein n=2 Tax=Leptospira mayottensis TaxID=1137606 RepID=A0AA87MSV8_9LEPT|nr:hypothetical protein DQM68_06435 [Leptospira mayottensis]AXR64199.1 hypothetical protein DQM28_08145 [Leptospira mayottensis]AZQ03186.1 hypothetical protein LEP1GSC190_15255 [Leptospira mayottensis 200901116]EKS02259.1 hypothetical protein LEP1GSC125_0723 [Leptospira mayottensis 200901122]TGN06642.1 hypothetical protein EHR03_10180 [Leptospira mayottensis]
MKFIPFYSLFHFPKITFQSHILFVFPALEIIIDRITYQIFSWCWEKRISGLITFEQFSVLSKISAFLNCTIKICLSLIRYTVFRIVKVWNVCGSSFVWVFCILILIPVLPLYWEILRKT